MARHYLKTWPKPFVDVWTRCKLYEVRLNDRDFYVGDTLQLQEYDPHAKTYSGREIQAVVIHKLMAADGDFGLKPGYCVLGLGDLYNRPKRDVDFDNCRFAASWQNELDTARASRSTKATKP